MGRRVNLVNEIEILEKMLLPNVQVMLKTGRGRPYVELYDTKSGTNVRIKGVPAESIVIKSDCYNGPFAVFNKGMNIRKRADFVIVSIDEEGKKWIIYIETKGGKKPKARIEAQLKGARCFITYCKCIGESFWNFSNFLEGYSSRFVCIQQLKTKKRGTSPTQPNQVLHDKPEEYKRFSKCSEIHFSKLIHQ